MGLIGCGTIGKALAGECRYGPLARRVQLTALYDVHREKAEALARRMRRRPEVALSTEALVRASDLILEAASPAAVPSLLRAVGRYRKDLLVMSTAGLLQAKRELRNIQNAGCRITIPSGALVGVDGLKSFSVGPIRRVTLTTRKPPRSFGLPSLRKAKTLLSGSALRAIRAYPQNVNVAATVLLAGIPLRKFHVRIIADPTLSRNAHELTVEGRDGRFVCRTENVPSSNPKTSRLAILSARRTFRQLFQPVHVGT